MKNKKARISLDEAERLLCLGQKSIRKHSKLGNLPKLKSDGNELFFHEEDLLKRFNLENFKEPFVPIAKASEIIGLSTAAITQYCGRSENPIPHYRLENKKGIRLLFLEAELEEWFELKLIYSPEHSNFRNKHDLFVELIKTFLDSNEKLSFLKEREEKILRLVILENKSLEEVSIVFNLDKERIRRFFLKSCERIKTGMTQISDVSLKNKELLLEITRKTAEKALLEEKNQELFLENKKFREQLGFKERREAEKLTLEEVLLTKLSDLEISMRTFHCFRSAGLETLLDLVRLKRNDFKKVRNAGKKTLIEVDALLESKKLRWGMGF